MANAEHLAKLKEGTAVWNQWRKDHPEVVPDLQEANLSGADLSEADLSVARFGKSDLSRAVLNGADFFQANLRQANLGGTRLIGSDLSATELTEANLTGSFLYYADFNGAGLSGADLSHATLHGTSFINVDLRSVKGLESVRHDGPSYIGIDTIYRSNGEIPEAFLRGAGVPDSFIAFMRSLAANPIDYYSCFISYSTKDQPFADRLYADLQAEGVRCWFAPHDIAGGKKTHEQIEEAIRLYDKLLLILSPASITSEWVKTEISKARKRELKEQRRMLFPVRLVDFESLRDWECFDADTGKDSACEIREYFVPDFSQWKDHDCYQKAFTRLLEDLRKSQEKQSPR